MVQSLSSLRSILAHTLSLTLCSIKNPKMIVHLLTAHRDCNMFINRGKYERYEIHLLIVG